MSALDDLIDRLYTARPFPIEQASCRGLDTNLFFPERGEDSSIAKRICFTCPVKNPCRDWALANNEKHGIWGGTSEKERRTRRRTRRTELADLTTTDYTLRVNARRTNGTA